MIHEQITLDGTIGFLNSLLKVDALAVHLLLEARVPCNRDMSMHSTVQCGEDKVGFLGVLNGLFGTYDEGPKALYGPITVHIEDGRILRFSRTVPNE